MAVWKIVGAFVAGVRAPFVELRRRRLYRGRIADRLPGGGHGLK